MTGSSLSTLGTVEHINFRRTIDKTSISKMPREVETSTNEREFILQALQEDIRLDGRPLDAYRQLDISFGDEYGVADVRLGKTRYEYNPHFGRNAKTTC